MSNKLSHHFQTHVFSQQPRRPIEQILPTSALAPAVMLTESGPAAGMPRVHPPDVLSDIARVSARQPAQPTSVRRRGLAATLVRFDPTGKAEPRTHTNPGTAANKHTSLKPHDRGARQHPEITPYPQELPERSLRGVRQDKDRNSCDRGAFGQPAVVNKFTRSQATSRKSARSQKSPSADNPRTQPVQVWVSPLVKAELTRIASSESLSLSAAGAALLERGLQQNVDMQYGALINPVIEKAIARQMAGLTTRLTWLLVRIAFDAGQTRSLVTNILGRQAGVTQPLLKTILEGSGRSAKANIMRRTPQIASLIQAVEQWMVEDDGGEKKKTYD